MEQKTILCPKCGRKVGTHDGKSTMVKSVMCSKCNKLVTYNPQTNKTILVDKPLRVTSSGKRFY